MPDRDTDENTYLGLDREDWSYMITKTVINMPWVMAVALAIYLLKS